MNLSLSTIYTCPMDPDIFKKGHGSCPKCGMDLVPIDKKDHSEHANHNSHTIMEESCRKRFFLTLPITIIILILSPKIQQWFNFKIEFSGIEIILFSLTSVIVFYAGWPFYQMAKGEIKSKTPAMMSLVSLAVLSGYIFSVAATF